ncbi:hypothetical protein B0T10DRAFT_574928 [Thelonectria olida]|uniref:AB hydrolase-1 domain-containing protein n=1 Tax=Thelonectria olida TaxID=1576542 RepID=A0A9P8W1G6_9HYPO|nr:hypothetical protein B0T10DRAFT_574928 [Thelonectria olida]
MGKLLQCLSLGLFSLLPALATPTASVKHCVQLDVPVTVSANNTRFDTPRVDSTIDAVGWIWDTYTWSRQNRTRGPVIPIHRTFTIAAELCVPSQGKKAHILQLATHGALYDKRYWDVQVKPQEYSYVDAAIRQGYSILTYDRLGNGGSTKPDGYDVVQLPTEVEILKELTNLARSGKLVKSSKIKGRGSPSSLVRNYKPSKIVHVGHSFGSFTTAELLKSYGKISDGAILTGYVIVTNPNVPRTQASTFGYEFARENDPERFADRGSGYIVQGTESSVQQIFLGKGDWFEPELLKYSEKVKQTSTVGEMLSATLVGGGAAQSFTGPIQFFVGEYDFPICGGDCKNSYDIKVIEDLYPKAAHRAVYLQPDTGHGLTVSKNATAGYQAMFSYLEAHGL